MEEDNDIFLNLIQLNRNIILLLFLIYLIFLNYQLIFNII